MPREMIRYNFSTMDELYESELADTLWEAKKVGVIDPEIHGELWTDKKEGMRWINEPPEPIDEQQRFQDRPEHYQQEEME